MKTKLIILASLFVVSCSTPDSTEKTPTTNCNCGIVIERHYAQVPSNFTFFKVKNNCTGEVTNHNQNGNVYPLGSEFCGN